MENFSDISTRTALIRYAGSFEGVTASDIKKLDTDGNHQIDENEAKSIGITDKQDIAKINDSLKNIENNNFEPSTLIFKMDELAQPFIDSKNIHVKDYVETRGDVKLSDISPETGKVVLSGSSKSQRQNILEQITQINSESYSKSECRAACLVAGAFYEGGIDGLKTLMEHTKKFAADNGIDLKNTINQAAFDDILKKLQNNPDDITLNDISVIQNSLFRVLERYESKTFGDENNPLGLLEDTTNTFISGNTKLNDYLINTRIMNVGQHAVLQFSQENGEQAIYDPYPLKNLYNGDKKIETGQVITDPMVLDIYGKAEFDYDEVLQVIMEKATFQ